MNKIATTLLTALLAAGALYGPASAQQYPYPGQGNGTWQNGTWQNGRCSNYRRNKGGDDRDDRDGDDRGCANRYGRQNAVRGAIVGVVGNQVTLRTGYRTITIDDQPALNNRTSGRVEIGRYVTAYGYWRSGEFFATRLV